MILAGADVPAGQAVGTPVSLLDVYPTVLDALGLPAERPSQLGDSLFRVMADAPAERDVIAEYHASGSRQGAFMLRHGRWKYVRHITYPPMLFDLAEDPEELRDLGSDPAHDGTRAMLDARLRRWLDPAEVDARARQRQAELLVAAGGAAAVRARGEIPYSPPPGVAPVWS
jgi:choline-sulfatase